MNIFFNKGTRYAVLLDESLTGFMKIEPNLVIDGIEYKKVTVWVEEGTITSTKIKIGGYRHADEISLDSHNHIPGFNTAKNVIKEKINIGLARIVA
jgi:hypothetical protein